MLAQEPLKLGGHSGQSVVRFGSRPIICKLFRIVGELLPMHFHQASGVGMQLALQARNDLVEFGISLTVECFQLVVSRTGAPELSPSALR